MRGLWLILLVPALGIVGCWEEPAKAQPAIDPDYPCGIGMRQFYPDMYSEHFLEWTPDGGHIIFDGRRSYDTKPLAIWTANAEGTSVRMIVDVNPGHPAKWGFHADVSPDGKRIVYSTCEFQTGYEGVHPARAFYHYEIAVLDLIVGTQLRLTVNSNLDHYPVWSPDGSRIAFIRNLQGKYLEFNAAIYMMEVDGSHVQNVAPWLGSIPHLRGETGEEDGSVPKRRGVALYPPSWSPDGSRLLFLVNEGQYRPFRKILYTVRPDGSELTRIAEDVVSVASWSPDGQRIAVAGYAGDDVSLFTLSADGSDKELIAPITSRETFERLHGPYRSRIYSVSWSPDGSQILYSCDFGACLVNLEDRHITAFTELGNGPYLAAWSPDGTRIALYNPGYYDRPPPQLYTIARDGTDRRDLITLDASGNLAPANPP